MNVFYILHNMLHNLNLKA